MVENPDIDLFYFLRLCLLGIVVALEVYSLTLFAKNMDSSMLKMKMIQINKNFKMYGYLPLVIFQKQRSICFIAGHEQPSNQPNRDLDERFKQKMREKQG